MANIKKLALYSTLPSFHIIEDLNGSFVLPTTTYPAITPYSVTHNIELSTKPSVLQVMFNGPVPPVGSYLRTNRPDGYWFPDGGIEIAQPYSDGTPGDHYMMWDISYSLVGSTLTIRAVDAYLTRYNPNTTTAPVTVEYRIINYSYL